MDLRDAQAGRSDRATPSAEEWAEIQALFHRLSDLPETEQATALEAVRRDAPGIAAAVWPLLVRDRSRTHWIERSIAAAARAVPAPASPLPQRIGPYRLVREIGRGGMGIVFEAEREDVFTKRVAIKLAAGALYADAIARRFDDERQILARLEHPSIARLLDGGTTDDGLPYLVMEYVDGVSITADIAARGATVPERLALFLQMCEAVQYAHENLVVHRDLKPANILVSAGRVRLLDFGIATLLSPIDERGGRTGTALVTLDYCSPEQLHGDPVTTRSDIYALGLVLYELLTDQQGQRADTRSPLALEQSICERPVPLPSATVNDRGDVGLARRLRGDLDTIVVTATDKDPSHRYATAAAMADDVRRHLAHEPIRARPASRWYRVTRFGRRHWRPLAAAAVVAVLLVVGVAVIVQQARQTERRFQQVRQLANTLMTDVHAAIRDLPASTPAQAIVVQTAVDYLNGLADEAGGDEELRLEVAQGFTQVATLAYSLSRPSLARPEDAVRYYEKADALLSGLERDNPTSPAILAARARFDAARAQFLDDRGRKAEALALVAGSIATAERAVALAPSDETALAALAEALSLLMADYEDSAPALAHIGRYLEVAERRAGAPGASASTLSDLAVAYAQAGKVADAGGDRETALPYYRRSIELQERALALGPENATIRRDLMLAWNHLGELSLGPRGVSSYSGSGARFTVLPAADQARAREAALETIEQATWLYDRDPSNVTVVMDYAIAIGRSAPAFPIGDAEPIRLLDRSLEALRRLGPEHAGGTAYFLIELHGSRAERHRQRGDIRMAIRDWEAVRREVTGVRNAQPSAYRPSRMVIPMFENWAMTLAEQGDRRGALALAHEIVRLGDEVGASEASYARAAGWPPRVRAWMAGFHDLLGDRGAAALARQESLRLWKAVAARADLPKDLVDEAHAEVAAAAPE